jgi:putative membrane protein
MSATPPTGELRGSEAPGAHPASGVASTAAASPARQSLLQAGRPTLLPRHFAWRLLLLRFFVNAVSLALTAIIVPHIFFAGNYRILTWLLVSAAFGLLNAFIKPLVQVVMLPFMFVSYGLVVVLINAIMLWILDLIFPTRFIVDHVFWALLGGMVFGLLSGFLENLLGLTPPIFEGNPEALREEIKLKRRERGLVETQLLAVTAGSETPEEEATPTPVGAPEDRESAEELGAHELTVATPPIDTDAESAPVDGAVRSPDSTTDSTEPAAP